MAFTQGAGCFSKKLFYWKCREFYLTMGRRRKQAKLKVVCFLLLKTCKNWWEFFNSCLLQSFSFFRTALSVLHLSSVLCDNSSSNLVIASSPEKIAFVMLCNRACKQNSRSPHEEKQILLDSLLRNGLGYCISPDVGIIAHQTWYMWYIALVDVNCGLGNKLHCVIFLRLSPEWQHWENL